MSYRGLTIGICFAVIVICGVWEVICAMQGQSEATFSDVIRDANTDAGWLPALAMAGLWIHFFVVPWFQRGTP